MTRSTGFFGESRSGVRKDADHIQIQVVIAKELVDRALCLHETQKKGAHRLYYWLSKKTRDPLSHQYIGENLLSTI